MICGVNVVKMCDFVTVQLHVMQCTALRRPFRPSVCLSVRLFVCLSIKRVDCDETEETCAHILISTTKDSLTFKFIKIIHFEIDKIVILFYKIMVYINHF